MASPREFIESDDPISRDSAKALLSHKEEDQYTDYKQTFHVSEEKAWLDLTIDVSAFANTYGGYLVFGVEDKSKKVVGLAKDVAAVFGDANNLLQKINRHLEPKVTELRCKTYRFDGKTVGIIFVPQSHGRTHVVSKDASFTHPSGKSQLRLRKGTFYVRRSGGVHLADARDLDDIVERRIDQFRDALLDKVAKVVQAPATSDVFILSKDPSDDEGKRFIIEDAPEAIPVKGMSFTVAPEGIEEEIAAWSVLGGGDSDQIPPPKVLWRWYAARKNLSISKGHHFAIFRFALWSDVPAFFWIRGFKNAEIRAELLEAIRNRPAGNYGKQMLIVAAFLGKASYRSAVSALGDSIDRLSIAMKVYPKNGPRRAFDKVTPDVKKISATAKAALEAELNEIATAPAKTGKHPALPKRWRAHEIDCCLYAQDDRYK